MRSPFFRLHLLFTIAGLGLFFIAYQTLGLYGPVIGLAIVVSVYYLDKTYPAFRKKILPAADALTIVGIVIAAMVYHHEVGWTGALIIVLLILSRVMELLSRKKAG